MAYVMTKRGQMDNAVANEFMCDTAADLAKIEKSEITFGSVAVVLDGMEVFIANSKKEWKSMTPTSNEEGDD